MKGQFKKHDQLIKHYYRMLAYNLAPSVRKLNISANTVTLLRLFCIIFYSFVCFLSSPHLALFILSLLSIWLFSFLDALDGEVAKISRTTILGRWLDPQIDRIGTAAIFVVNSYLLLKEYNSFLSLLPFLSYIFIDLNNGMIRDVNYKPKFSMLNRGSEKIIPSNESIKPNYNTKRSFASFLALNSHLHVHNICLLLIITSIFNSPLAFALICLARSILSLVHTSINMIIRICSYDSKHS